MGAFLACLCPRGVTCSAEQSQARPGNCKVSDALPQPHCTLSGFIAPRVITEKHNLLKYHFKWGWQEGVHALGAVCAILTGDAKGGTRQSQGSPACRSQPRVQRLERQGSAQEGWEATGTETA